MLPPAPFVARDFNRKTCIVAHIGPKKVAFVPMGAFNLATLSISAFEATFTPMAHSVASAAKAYIKATNYHRMTAAATEQLQLLALLDPAIGQDLTVLPTNQEIIMTSERPKAEPKVRKADTVYTATGVDTADLPAQARAIMAVITDNGGKITRELLLAKLSVIFADSKQPAQRILAFYQPRLVEGGYLVIGG